MKKLLITGGAGFIGGNFVHYMLEKYPDYEIYNLDKLTYAGDLEKHVSITGLTNYHFIQADITDEEVILPLFRKEKFDYIVHFAAESHVDHSIRNPSIFVQTNIVGTHVLLQAAKEIAVKKFLHVSTDEVYGELELGDVALFTEASPIKPNSPYSASKASSDLLVQSYANTYTLPINIARCTNNYGPFQLTEKLIPQTIAKALKGERIPLYGDGRNVRDWLHVHDHCCALDIILHKGEYGGIYNIGGHNERTNLEVIQAILNALNKSQALIEYVPDRLGHDRRYAINPSKLEQLGWHAQYNFETGLAQTIDWYVENRTWWELLEVY